MKNILVGLILFVLVGIFSGCNNSYEPPLLVVFDSSAIWRVEQRFTEYDTIWITPEFTSFWHDIITLRLMYTVWIDFPQDTTKPDAYSFTILNDYEIKNLLNQNPVSFSSFFLRFHSRDVFLWTEYYGILVHDYSINDIERVYRLEARWGSKSMSIIS